MRLALYIHCLMLLTSCSTRKIYLLDYSSIDEIEVYHGDSGTKIKMIDGFEKQFIYDLNESKDVGVTKYIKTHSVLIHYKNGEIDTLLTNGIIHQFKGWAKSEIDLLKKYSEPEDLNLSDTIHGQLQIAKRLKVLMASKKYNKAIQLFSLEQQKNILEIKKDKEMFEYWCVAWTFDEVKYNRYVSKIKGRKAYFILENNEWKINEK